MLSYRIISAALGIPLIIWASYTGGTVFFLLVGGLILAGTYEYLAMVRQQFTIYPVVFFPSAGLLALSFVFRETAGLAFFLILGFHLLSIVFGESRPVDAAVSFFGVWYIAWTLGHLILIREEPAAGFTAILLCFIITWATDTGAYFTGRAIGRHKLSPLISPKKTVEGAVGGILLCILAVMVMGHFMQLMQPLPLFILAALASVTGQIGDLAESAIKRMVGVKDSGRVIPGHGGVLDRFDSLILVAPLVYYFIRLVAFSGAIKG